MTDIEAQKEAASEELREIMNWFNKETDNITDKLKQSGEWRALDGQRAAYRPAYEELNRRIKMLIAKYPNLPGDTKIAFVRNEK